MSEKRFLAVVCGTSLAAIAVTVLGIRLLGDHGRPDAVASATGRISYLAPTPTPIDILWVDSAGNLGLRGVEAVIPGKPDEKAKISDACRASAEKNGAGVLTVCMVKDVGAAVKAQLGK